MNSYRDYDREERVAERERELRAIEEEKRRRVVFDDLIIYLDQHPDMREQLRLRLDTRP